jgi:hypothetical protein
MSYMESRYSQKSINQKGIFQKGKNTKKYDCIRFYGSLNSNVGTDIFV